MIESNPTTHVLIECYRCLNLHEKGDEIVPHVACPGCSRSWLYESWVRYFPDTSVCASCDEEVFLVA